VNLAVTPQPTAEEFAAILAVLEARASQSAALPAQAQRSGWRAAGRAFTATFDAARAARTRRAR
jgi:hypothetical protein